MRLTPHRLLRTCRLGIVLFAGIFDDTEEGPRFVVLTIGANEVVAAAHDRMPAVLGYEDAKKWRQ